MMAQTSSTVSLTSRMHGGTSKNDQERMVNELNALEVTIKHTGIKLDPAEAKRIANALLDKTSVLRFTYDRLNREVKQKERQIKEMEKEALHARTEGESTLLGVRGEKTLTEKLARKKKELVDKSEKADIALNYQQMLKHIQKRTKCEIRSLKNSELCLQQEIDSTVKSEPVLRQTRLKAYQLLAREKRNLDMILEKQAELRKLQQIKINEAMNYISTTERKRVAMKQKADAYRAKLNAQLEEEMRRRDGEAAKRRKELAEQHDELMEQLAPLEAVFDKIQARTGMVSFSADDIASLFIGQRESSESLKRYYKELTDRLAELQNWSEKLKKMEKELSQGSAFSQSKKGFYDCLAKYESEEIKVDQNCQKQQAKMNLYKINIASCKTFVNNMYALLEDLPLKGQMAPLKSAIFQRKEYNYSDLFNEIVRVLKEYHPNISTQNTKKETEFSDIRGKIANNSVLLSSPPSNVRVARRRANESNGYMTDEDSVDLRVDDGELMPGSVTAFTSKWNNDEGIFGQGNGTDSSEEDDDDMQLSKRLRNELKTSHIVATLGSSNGKKKTATSGTSSILQSQSERKAFTTRKMKKRNSTMKPSAPAPKGRGSIPMKSPNASRRVTRVGKLSSPNSPINKKEDSVRRASRSGKESGRCDNKMMQTI